MTTPDTDTDTDLIPVTQPVTLFRWRQLVARVRDLRACQREYRRTIDPLVRRRMERAEWDLDAELGWLIADLAAADVLAAEAAAAGEGGEA